MLQRIFFLYWPSMFFYIKLLFFSVLNFSIFHILIISFSILYGLDSLQKTSLVDPSSDVSVECGQILDTEALTIQGFVVVVIHLQTSEVIVSQREHIHPSNLSLLKAPAFIYSASGCVLGLLCERVSVFTTEDPEGGNGKNGKHLGAIPKPPHQHHCLFALWLAKSSWEQGHMEVIKPGGDKMFAHDALVSWWQ